MLKILRIFYLLMVEMFCQMFYFLPIKKNKVVFDNFGGRGFGCDPKYIAEELRKSGEKLDLIWLTQNLEMELPDGIRPVKYASIRCFYELATAKIWIDNFRCAPRVYKKKEQFYIQTWHSALGLKKNEGDAKNLRKTYLMYAKRDAKWTNLMYANNQFRENLYQTRFWYDGEVLRCGAPRNQILIHPPCDVVRKVKDHFEISGDKKILLYAPTFRKGMDCSAYKFDIEKILKLLEKQFGGEYVALVRLHPNLANIDREWKAREEAGVYDATKYSDIQELLATADCLITDFSGIMFDFMLRKKPVFLFAKDLKDYMKNDRELYFEFDELPFSMAEDEGELIQNITKFNQVYYEESCCRFMESIDMKDDGNGAREISDLVLKKILG